MSTFPLRFGVHGARGRRGRNLEKGMENMKLRDWTIQA